MGTETAEVKVVLDTNVVVSALLFPRGQMGWLAHLWASGRIVPLVCTATAREFIRVLAYPKFKLGPDDVQAVLSAYLPFTETVAVSEARGRKLPRCRDTHDQIFLELVYAGKAEVLVSGDIALQELAGRVPFAIESPAAFRERFK